MKSTLKCQQNTEKITMERNSSFCWLSKVKGKSSCILLKCHEGFYYNTQHKIILHISQ